MSPPWQVAAEQPAILACEYRAIIAESPPEPDIIGVRATDAGEQCSLRRWRQWKGRGCPRRSVEMQQERCPVKDIYLRLHADSPDIGGAAAPDAIDVAWNRSLIGVPFGAVKVIENCRLTVRQSIVEGIAGPPKNYRERDVSLDETALSAISLVPRTHELVFHRGDGRPLTCSTAQGALARACRRAGLRHIGWHALRHTFASRLAASGVPITVVQGLLGHSTIVMTMRYTHTAPEAYAKAVSALPSNQSALGISFWATGGQRPLVPVNATLSAGIV